MTSARCGAVGAIDAHRGIQREAPTVVPARHVVGIGVVEMTGAGKPARNTRMCSTAPSASGWCC